MKTPLMPKGVEHATAKKSAKKSRPMKTPLMPKGVEHVVTPTGSGSGVI